MYVDHTAPNAQQYIDVGTIENRFSEWHDGKGVWYIYLFIYLLSVAKYNF